MECVKNVTIKYRNRLIVIVTMSVTYEIIREIRKKIREIEELLETLEIMQDKELIEEIREAEREVREGRAKRFTSLEEAFKWLESENES